MKGAPRIVVVDRSALAANLYRLLLTPLGAAPIVRGRIDQALAALPRHASADLVIVSASALGASAGAAAANLMSDPRTAAAPKLFLIGPREADAAEDLAAIERASILARPFHPEEFVARASELLARRRP